MPCDTLLLHFIWIVCNKVVYLQRLSLRTILNFSRASGGFSEVPDFFYIYRSPKIHSLLLHNQSFKRYSFREYPLLFAHI